MASVTCTNERETRNAKPETRMTPDYSYLSASMGFSFDALNAG